MNVVVIDSSREQALKVAAEHGCDAIKAWRK